MDKERAPRNRTITLNAREQARLAPELLHVDAPVEPEQIANRIVCGDTLQVLPLLPRGFADLIVADPPYNLTKSFGTNSFSRVSEARYEEFLRSWLPPLVELLSPSGSIYVCCDWRSSCVVARVLGECATLRNRITWQREKGRGAAANWKNAMEDIWYAVRNPRDFCFNVDAVRQRRTVRAPYRHNGEPKDWHDSPDGRYRLTCPSNFWDDISVPFWSMPENTDHPTQKPEKLIAKLILASSRPGDLVFDPFLGSGTTAVTAAKLDRRFAGIELNPQYAMLALKRLEMVRTDRRIQGMEDGVFYERNSRPDHGPATKD